MSKNIMNPKRLVTLALLTLTGTTLAQAVKSVDAPYMASGVGKASMVSDMPFAPAQKSQELPVAAPPLVLVPGLSIATQLSDVATKAGWQLVWEAADFTVGSRIPVSSDLVKAVTALIDSANANGTRLRANFYRGNNIVHVTEF